MGVVCFLCQAQFENVEALMKHLSSARSHNLNQYSDYECGQPSCSREYTGSRSFVRHIRKEHASDLTPPWIGRRRCTGDSSGIQHSTTVVNEVADESSSDER